MIRRWPWAVAGWSLEARLNLSIALIMLLIISLGFVWTLRDVRSSVREEANASVALALALIDAIPASVDRHPAAIQTWIEQISHLEKIRHLRISVSGDENAHYPMGSSHPGTQDSLVPAWFRWAVISDPVMVIREIVISPGDSVTIHVESSAEDEIREAWDEAMGGLGLHFLLAISIYCAVHWIVGRALRPVAAIVQGLTAIEDGDYDMRLPLFGLPELDRIAQGINHMSSTLGRTRDENRALTLQRLTIQEDERRSMAHEIHDEFGQNLTAIKMMNGMILENPAAAVRLASEIQQLCDRLFTVVRSVTRRLRPMILDDLGLYAALEDLLAHWQTGCPQIQIQLDCQGDISAVRGDLALAIYRLIQEALTNAMRHADATLIRLSLVRDCDGSLLVSIADNGKGMVVQPRPAGLGLVGMRERVASLRGHLEMISRPGHGTEIRISIPAEPA